jgi:hypothetical protein
MILTGRPNLFLDNEELKAALGIRREGSGKVACESWFIEPFDIAQIERALRAWPDAVRNGIVLATAEKPRLLDIVGRPALLHVMSVLWRDGEISDRVSELTSAEVIGRFVDASLQRQAEKARTAHRGGSGKEDRGAADRHEAHDYMVLNTAERRYFMLGVAAHMMKVGETNQISGSELSEITTKLAHVCPESVSRAAGALEDEAHPPIRRRIQESGKFLAKVQDDVRTAGLLVVDPTSDSAFRFGHKSFLEYFAADYAERVHAGEEDDAVDAIESVVNTAFVEILRTSVARGFFGELILWRRAGTDVSMDNLLGVARYLLQRILRPGIVRRMAWGVSVRVLRIMGHQGWWGRDSVIAVLMVTLGVFTVGPARIVSKMLSRVLIVMAATMMVVSMMHWRSAGVVREGVVAAGLMAMTIWILMVGVLMEPAGGRRTRLARTWVDSCRSLGIPIEVVYSALGGLRDQLHSSFGDPVEIYDRGLGLGDVSNEKLQESIGQGGRDSKRAFLELAGRHSLFGRLLASRDCDGVLPGRDPSKPVGSKEVKAAAGRAGVVTQEVEQVLGSLNAFLGWDVRRGRGAAGGVSEQ